MHVIHGISKAFNIEDRAAERTNPTEQNQLPLIATRHTTYCVPNKKQIH